MINTIIIGSDCNENDDDDVTWEIITQSTIKKQIIKRSLYYHNLQIQKQTMKCSAQCIVLKQLKMVICAQGCHKRVSIWFQVCSEF